MFVARDCIIPDTSRTYHFGEDGLNVKTSMQERYFKHHALHKTNEFTVFPPAKNYIKNQYDAGKETNI